MGRVGRLLGVVACCVTTVLGPLPAGGTTPPHVTLPSLGAVSPMVAAGAQLRQADGPPVGSTGRAPLMIVLDASGSMGLQDAPGERMDVARSAVDEVVGSLPADASVGLTVYGTSTGANTSERAAGCADVTLLRPIGPLDREALRDVVDGVEPSGYSPIGAALRQAATGLPDTGPRSILLVSDGFDFCSPPDPCAVAKELARTDPDLAIHVIGVQVNAAAAEQLSCIAVATGGVYVGTRYDPPPDRSGWTEQQRERDRQQQETERTRAKGLQDQLAERLRVGYQRAATAYTAVGDAITGSPEPSEDAPVMTPGGYLDDTFSRGTYAADGGRKNGTVRYYRVPLGAGMTPWVSATLVGDRRSEDHHQRGLRLTLVDAEDDACLTASEETTSGGDRDPLPLVTVTAGGVQPGADGWSAECRVDAPVFLRVERLGEYGFGRALPVQLQVRSEPPVATDTDRSEATAPDAGPEVTAPAAGPATVVAGGSSFATATPLTPGSTIADSLVAGETRFYVVPVGWGQRLQYRVSPSGLGTPVDGGSGGAVVAIRNPLWVPVEVQAQQQNSALVKRDYGTGSADAGGAADTDAAADLTGSTAVPVAWGNRASDDADMRGYATAGRYYLLLSLAPSTANTAPSPTNTATTGGLDYTVPFTLTVAVQNTPDAPSAPKYLGGNGSGVARSTPAVTPDDVAVGAVPPSSGFLPGWLWAIGGAALALVLAAGVALLFRRRTRSTSRPR